MRSITCDRTVVGCGHETHASTASDVWPKSIRRSFMLLGTLLLTLATREATASLPPDYVACAKEGHTCTFNGDALVYYGADTRWSVRDATSEISCNNEVFGDVAPGTRKTCFVPESKLVKPPLRYGVCAEEGQTCTFPGEADIYFGVSPSWSVVRANGTIACNNQTFGDPAPGTRKQCYGPIVYTIGETGPAGGIVISLTADGTHGVEMAREEFTTDYPSALNIVETYQWPSGEIGGQLLDVGIFDLRYSVPVPIRTLFIEGGSYWYCCPQPHYLMSNPPAADTFVFSPGCANNSRLTMGCANNHRPRDQDFAGGVVRPIRRF